MRHLKQFRSQKIEIVINFIWRTFSFRTPILHLYKYNLKLKAFSCTYPNVNCFNNRCIPSAIVSQVYLYKFSFIRYTITILECNKVNVDTMFYRIKNAN